MQRNPRQKKKSSQAKKRYYDTTKAKDSKIHQEKSPSDQHKNTDTQNKEPVQITRDKDGTVSVGDRKIYSKRKVASNWDRYKHQDDVEGQVGSSRTWESEEQLQQRLVQLLNLPVHHSPLSTIEHPVADEAYSTIGSSFLSLDCDSLALSLSSLPLHERLHISQELLELNQCGGNDSGIEMSSNLKDQNISVSPGKIAKRINVKEETIDVDLKVLLTEQKQPRTSGHKQFNFQVTSIGIPVVTKEASKYQQSQEVQSDKQLDSLLEQSITKPKHEHTTKEKVEITVADNRSVPQPSGETDELDEMLDELLA